MDSGNDESDPMWLPMIDHADQLVVATTTRNDHAEAGALLVEALEQRDDHSAQLAANAVAIDGILRYDVPSPGHPTGLARRQRCRKPEDCDAVASGSQFRRGGAIASNGMTIRRVIPLQLVRFCETHTMARPKLSTNPLFRVTVTAEERVVEEFDDVCRELGLTRSEVMRRLMRQWIDENGDVVHHQEALPVAS